MTSPAPTPAGRCVEPDPATAQQQRSLEQLVAARAGAQRPLSGRRSNRSPWSIWVELLPSRLMRAAADVLPVAGAGISCFGGMEQPVPWGASDDAVVLPERLPFTVGESPCLSARLEDPVVLATADLMARRWPIFRSQLVEKTPYQEPWPRCP